MRERELPCPSDDVLLRLTSDDLSGRAGRAARRHVEGCASCRDRLLGYQRVFDDYRTLVGASDDGREAARKGQFRRLMRAEAQVRPRVGPPAMRWLVQGAAVIVMAGALILWSRHTEVTLSAEALIARAIDGENEVPTPAGETVAIGVAPGRARALPAAAGEEALAGAERVSERGQMAQELARRLAGHWFDWRTPLSARTFQHWRASIARPRDSLEWIGPSRIRVSTTALDGLIVSAELELEVPLYRPVGQVWRFADGFEVELRTAPPAAPRPAPPAAAPVSHAASSLARHTPAPVIALDEAELQARVLLERLQLPVGRHLSVRRTKSTVAIDASVGAGGVAGDLTTAAARLPRVEVRVGPRRAAARESLAGASSSPGLAQWLDRTFGASPLNAAFLGEARDLRADLADAGQALGELAARYPAPAAARLPAAARERLDSLAEAYYVRLTVAFERLEQHLAPLTGTLGRRVLPAHAPDDWRELAGRVEGAMAGVGTALDAVADPELPTGEALERRAQDVLKPALAAVASATAK